MQPTASKDFSLFRRLLLEARPYWGHILLIFGVSVLATPLALLIPLPLKVVVDNVLGDKPLPGFLAAVMPQFFQETTGRILLLAALLAVFVSLMRQVQGLANSYLQAYTGEHLVRAFRAKLFRHVQRLSLTYHDARGTADSVYRIQNDARSIQYIAINGVFPFVTATATVVSMMVIIARLEWTLVIIPLLVVPTVILLVRESRRRLRQRWIEAKEIESSAMGVVQEVLSAVRVVKAFGTEDQEQSRFVRRSNEGAQGQIRIALTAGIFDMMVGVTIALGTAAALWIGVQKVQGGTLSLGGLLIVMSYLAQLYSPLDTISKKSSQLQASLASAERAFALLDEMPEVVDKPHGRPLARAKGEIAFAGVSFGYKPERLVLRDVSFAIPPGGRVAITGATGSGKTTLAGLVSRFYDPNEGMILLDGLDLRDYRLADVRQQFAIVPQDPVLFSTTIAENIAYARPDASEADIEAAAKAANAHDFIVRLPEGYATVVGERGMSLSGGERQRISIARAFLKDAPILILDEPTSALDVETETTLMEAMERLMRGRTSLTIAHRLSTVKNCDWRLHFESGRVEMRRASAALEQDLANEALA
jgi:ATP-binding cassette subfamily B protein